jgi:hypothetical protein
MVVSVVVRLVQMILVQRVGMIVVQVFHWLALLDQYIPHEHVQFVGVLVYQFEFVGTDDVYDPSCIRSGSGGNSTCSFFLGDGKQNHEHRAQ